MRGLALGLLLLLTLPTALAATTYHHTYVMYGAGCSSGGLVRNCARYAPPPAGSTNVTAVAEDISGESVRVRICHEWTYDDGSHPTVRCDQGCDSVTSAVIFPPSSGIAYRVFVDLRGGPGACEAYATAGSLTVTFT